MASQRFFDRLADRVEKVVSHAAFFGGCVLLIILWLPLRLWLDTDTWQLIINTITTCITFLLLALLTNTQRRFERRTDEALRKLGKESYAPHAEASGRASEAE